MKRIFFDTDPVYNCLRIEAPNPQGKFLAELPPSATSVRLMDDHEIPADRTFRNAWKADFSIDMLKALSIAQAVVRDARAPKLAALDAEFMRAVEAGDQAKQAQIAAQKQRLRDATADTRLTNAQTPDALKAAMQAVIAGL